MEKFQRKYSLQAAFIALILLYRMLLEQRLFLSQYIVHLTEAPYYKYQLNEHYSNTFLRYYHPHHLFS